MSGHTKGPWGMGLYFDVVVSTEVGHRVIADVRPESSDDLDEAEAVANARLIAAAPELLEACEVALEKLRSVRPGDGLGPWAEETALEDAIAKAKGEG